MNEYLVVLLLATMPALGNFAGGALSEVFGTSRRTLNLALHAAAGVVIAVVAVELMPQAIEADPPWLIVLAFVLGVPSTWPWIGASNVSTTASAAGAAPVLG